jgi:hypothetical protein
VQVGTSHFSQQMAREQSTMQATNHRPLLFDMNLRMTSYATSLFKAGVKLVIAARALR